MLDTFIFLSLNNVSKLTNIGFDFYFENSVVNLFWNKSIIGISFLMNGLYKLDLNLNFKHNHLSIYGDNIGIKKNIIKENSSSLWHKN